MRTADTILAVIRDRGQRGLPLARVYRILFNEDLYLRAYGRLATKQGALTKGSTDETIDGMSMAKIHRIMPIFAARPIAGLQYDGSTSQKQREKPDL